MFRWVPRGSGQHIAMPTLGNLLGQKFRIVIEGFSYDNSLMANNYLFSQMGSTGGTREFGLFFNNANGRVEVFYGGQQNVQMTASRQVFFDNDTGSVDGVLFDWEIDTATGAWRLLTDDVLRSSGSVSLTGTGRIDGMKFRFGARGSTDDPNSDFTTFFLQPNQVRIGTTRIYLNDFLVRELVMPGGVETVIPDVVGGLDAVVAGAAIDPSVWDAWLEGDFSLAVSSSVDSLDFGGSTNLSVASVSAAVAVDPVVLVQESALEVSALGLAVALDSVVLAQSSMLSVGSVDVGVAMGAVSLHQDSAIAVAGVQVSVAVDGVALVQQISISVANVRVPIEVGGVALVQESILSVAGSSVALLVDGVALSVGDLLVVGGVELGVGVSESALIQANLIAVSAVALVVSVGDVVLALDSVIDVADLVVSTFADPVVLDQSSVLVVADVDVSMAAVSPILQQQGVLSIDDLQISIFTDSLTIGGGVFVAESALGMIIRDFQYVLLVEG